MKLSEAVLNYLTLHGLLRLEAAAVLASIQSAFQYRSFTEHWDSQVDSLSVEFRGSVLQIANTEALGWMERNRPEHPARGIFDGGRKFWHEPGVCS